MAGVDRVLTCLEMATVDDFFAPGFDRDAILNKKTVFAGYRSWRREIST